MSLISIYIDNLFPETDYYIESCKTGKKYKGTFCYISGDGVSAVFKNVISYEKNMNMLPIQLNSEEDIMMRPKYLEFNDAIYFHKTSDDIKRKVENKNETIYQKALEKVLKDLFCPEIHYDENGNPMFDENGNYLNYKTIFQEKICMGKSK